MKGLKVVSSNSTSITLHWNSDKKDGIWYEVDCLWCEEEDCGSNLKKQCQYAAYSPSKMFIKVNKVTVSGLETSNTYQFKVYSVSKLNEFEKDKTKWKFETVTGRTVSGTVICIFRLVGWNTDQVMLHVWCWAPSVWLFILCFPVQFCLQK